MPPLGPRGAGQGCGAAAGTLQSFSLMKQMHQGIIVVKTPVVVTWRAQGGPGNAAAELGCWPGPASMPVSSYLQDMVGGLDGGSAERPCPVLLPYLTCGHYVTSPVQAPQGSQHRPDATNSTGDCHLSWFRVRKCNPHTQRSENPTSFV